MNNFTCLVLIIGVILATKSSFYILVSFLFQIEYKELFWSNKFYYWKSFICSLDFIKLKFASNLEVDS